MIDENMESGDEVKLVSDNSPTLTGDVGYFQDQSEPSQNPPEMQKRIMNKYCLLYTSPSPRDQRGYRMPSSA